MTPDDDVEQAMARVRDARMAATQEDVEALVTAMQERYETAPEARRLVVTHDLLDEYEARVQELAATRRHLIDALLGMGWTQTDIATLLGITRSRVNQLTRRDDPN